MAGQSFLFVPGPSNVPNRILRAMAVPMEDHRSVAFPELTHEIIQGLKKLFRTEKAHPIVFPSSGTGCWEAALSNCLNPGDRVLIARFGQFSHLWAEMAKRLGFDVIVLDEEWGTGASPKRFHEVLSKDTQHAIKAVLICQNETATGVTSSVPDIRAALDDLKHPALLMVDSVSALGSIDFRMDDWAVDICISGSQKGLMLPAGMGITCVSLKALEQTQHNQYKRCYFDYQDMIRSNETGYFPYTPSIPMLHGLRESLRIINEEGLDQIISRHAFLAGGVRSAILDGWKLKLCAKHPDWYSNTVSTVMVPDGFNAAIVIEHAYRRYQLALGAGLSQVAGKAFRIGHLGDLNELMLMAAITGSEMAMLDLGYPIEAGSGSAAAATYWRQNSPRIEY